MKMGKSRKKEIGWRMEGWREEVGGRYGGVGGQGDWRARRRKLNEMSPLYNVRVNIS